MFKVGDVVNYADYRKGWGAVYRGTVIAVSAKRVRVAFPILRGADIIKSVSPHNLSLVTERE